MEIKYLVIIVTIFQLELTTGHKNNTTTTNNTAQKDQTTAKNVTNVNRNYSKYVTNGNRNYSKNTSIVIPKINPYKVRYRKIQLVFIECEEVRVTKYCFTDFFGKQKKRKNIQKNKGRKSLLFQNV